MNIVLIGYRGTGKSAVAEQLHLMTGKKKISIDEEVVRQSGMSIPQLVESHGWGTFRELESGLTAHYSAFQECIIDTGGGVVLKSANLANLQETGILVWLTATVDTIVSRIGEDTNRPALKEGKTFVEEIQEVLSERESLYREAANFEVATDAHSPEEIAAHILQIIPR